MEAGRLAVAILVGQAGMMGTGTGATAVGRGWILDIVKEEPVGFGRGLDMVYKKEGDGFDLIDWIVLSKL